MSKPSVFGDSAPALGTAFVDRANEDREAFVISEHVGKTVIVDFLGTKDIKTQKYGVKTAVALNVKVVDVAKGKIAAEYEDSLIFSAAVVDQARNYVGQRAVICSVGSYDSNYGTTGYKFEAPSPEGLAAAQALLAE